MEEKLSNYEIKKRGIHITIGFISLIITMILMFLTSNSEIEEIISLIGLIATLIVMFILYRNLPAMIKAFEKYI